MRAELRERASWEDLRVGGPPVLGESLCGEYSWLVWPENFREDDMLTVCGGEIFRGRATGGSGGGTYKSYFIKYSDNIRKIKVPEDEQGLVYDPLLQEYGGGFLLSKVDFSRREKLDTIPALILNRRHTRSRCFR